MGTDRSYLPAAGHDACLWLYDPITRLFGMTRALRALVDQAELRPGYRVLDIGCGTGTLAALLARTHPDVAITGLDPDPKALARAARKCGHAGGTIRFERGFADALPFPDSSFDRVCSSMMLHHVRKNDRPRVLAESRRVLRPGGRLEILDFSGPHHSPLAGLVHRHHALPVAEDRLLARLADAGFVDVRRVAARRTAFGPIAFYQAINGPRT